MQFWLSNKRTKSKGVIPFTCWALKLILKDMTTSNWPSLQATLREFSIGTFYRCCAVIRYSRIVSKLIRFLSLMICYKVEYKVKLRIDECWWIERWKLGRLLLSRVWSFISLVVQACSMTISIIRALETTNSFADLFKGPPFTTK